tara:strand:- start:858 stop:1046 length:189 start_codon:yes stop_codon:yes gene_type:complete
LVAHGIKERNIGGTVARDMAVVADEDVAERFMAERFMAKERCVAESCVAGHCMVKRCNGGTM